MLLEHKRYDGLGMDALVSVCSWNMNVIMVWAWMLWWAYPLGTRRRPHMLKNPTNAGSSSRRATKYMSVGDERDLEELAAVRSWQKETRYLRTSSRRTRSWVLSLIIGTSTRHERLPLNNLNPELQTHHSEFWTP